MRSPGAFSAPGIKDQTPLIFPHRAGSLTIFLGLFWMLSILPTPFLNCGDHNWTQYPRSSLTSTEQSGMITSLPQLVMSCRRSPGCDLPSLLQQHTADPCSACSPGPHVPFSKAAPRLWLATCLFCVKCRTLHFCVLIFLLAHSSSLSRFLSQCPSVLSASPPNLVPSANMVTVLSISSSRSFMKRLNIDHHDLSASFLPILQTTHLICILPVFLEVLCF